VTIDRPTVRSLVSLSSRFPLLITAGPNC